MSQETFASLKELGLRSIKELEFEYGVRASGRDEAYGCLFGRDSLLVALELLRAHEKSPNGYYLELVEKILRSLANLQGRHTNIESGEEPGKIVHEFRPEKHEHLTKLAEDPWFIYPEGVMRNYDTVDATPLFLIAVHQFGEILRKESQKKSPRISRHALFEDKKSSGPDYFFRDSLLRYEQLMPAVRAALRWIKTFDGFVTYSWHPDRKSGGLKVQSWMDSTESVFFEHANGRPLYPIAPVEVQAYAWSALVRWGEAEAAAQLKKKFNEKFVIKGPKSVSLAYAIDGQGRQLRAARSSMGHVLWAAVGGHCILEEKYIDPLRRRLLSRDLFVPSAGVRTLSSRSLKFDPHSYHNGSIWPHDTAMLSEGLENFGYTADAERVRTALLRAYAHFNTPIELFAYKRGFKEYTPSYGGKACRVQAWSAAALLSVLAASSSSHDSAAKIEV